MTTAPIDPARDGGGQGRATEATPAGSRAIDRNRVVRIVALILSGVIAVGIALEVVEILTNLDRLAFPIDGDRVLYMDAARSWLNGTGFYHDYQLAGPYDVRSGDILYPPPMLLVFAPLAAILPEPLSASSTTPSRSGSPSPVISFRRPSSVGRPSCSASGGRRRSSSSPAATPASGHGLHGARDVLASVVRARVPEADARPVRLLRREPLAWWVALGVLGLVSLLFLPMWFDYVAAINDGGGGLFYSIGQAPMLSSARGLGDLVLEARRRLAAAVAAAD